MRPADVARLGLVRSFQISAVFPHLTALENVRIALQRKRGDNFDFWRSKRALTPLNARAHELLDDVGLSESADRVAGEISYGRKRALEIATTLALDPEMLLLDEPMAGMGHEDIDRISALIRRVSAHRTILMVEHNLQVVAHLSDRITVLTRGRVLAEGDDAAVSENADVKTAYLGADMLEAAPMQLAVSGLQAWYGESHILHGVDFGVRPGEVVTLLGRNGAGKTTTLKSIMGIVGRRKGSARFEGSETIGLSSARIARLGVAICPEERGIFASLSVRENSDVAAPDRGDRRVGTRTDLHAVPELKERLYSGGGKLSGGEQQMLPSREFFAPARASSCSTNRPRASRPSSSSRSGAPLPS